MIFTRGARKVFSRLPGFWILFFLVPVLVEGLTHPLARADLEIPGFISTVAGTGIAGYSGDGGAAINASITSPQAIALDRDGNLYIAEGLPESRIRKVDSSGLIVTVAGTGSSGYLGDGGPATDASLGTVEGIAIDSNNNLYIASATEHRIRKVNTLGTITTIAGNGTQGFSGDGGPATLATLNSPFKVTVDDSDNLYFADGLRRARKIDTNGIITTVAGNGEQGCYFPCGDGGPATNARLFVSGLAVDSQGNIFISHHLFIRKVDATGTLSTIAGVGSHPLFLCSESTGPATSVTLSTPIALSLDALGQLYIADIGSTSCVRRLAGGLLSVVAGFSMSCPPNNGCPIQAAQDDGRPAQYTNILYPSDVTVSPTLDVFFSEPSRHRVRKVNGSHL